MSKPFRIVPKRDFGPNAGFYRNGKFTRVGFIVTDEHRANIMPGGTFFSSIPDAFAALRIWVEVNSKQDTAYRRKQEFWRRFYDYQDWKKD